MLRGRFYSSQILHLYSPICLLIPVTLPEAGGLSSESRALVVSLGPEGSLPTPWVSALAAGRIVLAWRFRWMWNWINLMITKWPYKSVGNFTEWGNFSPAFPVLLGFTGNKLKETSRLFCSPGFGKIGECCFLDSNKSILDMQAKI